MLELEVSWFLFLRGLVLGFKLEEQQILVSWSGEITRFLSQQIAERDEQKRSQLEQKGGQKAAAQAAAEEARQNERRRMQEQRARPGTSLKYEKKFAARRLFKRLYSCKWGLMDAPVGFDSFWSSWCFILWSKWNEEFCFAATPGIFRTVWNWKARCTRRRTWRGCRRMRWVGLRRRSTAVISSRPIRRLKS